MRNRIICLVALLSICTIFIVGLYVHFAAKGCRYNTAAATAMYQARQSWKSGQTAKSLSQFIAALRVGLECDVRCQIAQPHIDRMSDLERARHLEGAIAECVKASQALDACDVEGTFDYVCNVLEMRLLLTPTPTSIPTPIPDAER